MTRSAKSAPAGCDSNDAMLAIRSVHGPCAEVAARRMNRKSIIAGLTAVLLATALVGGMARAESPDVLETVQDHLYAGRTAAAAAAMHARLREAADDDQARFALGAAQFVQAVERLAQSSYRYGLRASTKVFDLPFFRLPVPENPTPAPLTYEGARAILQAFVTDLARSERTLAAVDDPAVKLPLNIGLIRLDMNADGEIADDETLWRIVQRIANIRRISQAEAERFVVDFDAGDVLWLRGYCNLLMALAETLLAHDWHVAFEHTFHALFPRAGLPFAILNDKAADNSSASRAAEWADFVAFVHLSQWPVAEPERLARALAHLENVVALSRVTWEVILAETDDENEWIPSPAQSGVIPSMPVTQGRVDGWLLFLDEFEALLQGRKVLPHWRLDKGINLRRVFLEPSTFDAILWVQGTAAIPYLEDGELSTDETWEKIFDLFRGDFFSYAIWFN